MFTSDPCDALVVAHEHARHLRDEAAAERFRPNPRTRRALASSLRCLADRLDPASFTPRPA